MAENNSNFRRATEAERAEIRVGDFVGKRYDRVIGNIKTKDREQQTFQGQFFDKNAIPQVGERYVERIEQKNPGRTKKILDRALNDIEAAHKTGGVRFRKVGDDPDAMKLARIRYMRRVAEDYERKQKGKYEPEKTAFGYKVEEFFKNSKTTQKIMAFLLIATMTVLTFRFLFFPLFIS